MAKVSELRGQSLADIAEYHSDAVEALGHFFGDWATLNVTRYVGFTPTEIRGLLENRLEETSLRSALQVLASLEAAFRIDYVIRCLLKKKDALSRDFRDLYKLKKTRVRLSEDILERWLVHQSHINGLKRLIGEMRGALRFRHWLAHGRYWEPKNLAQKYDYDGVSILADLILETFPLYRN
jgi:hypothetical protein